MTPVKKWKNRLACFVFPVLGANEPISRRYSSKLHIYEVCLDFDCKHLNQKVGSSEPCCSFFAKHRPLCHHFDMKFGFGSCKFTATNEFT